MSPAVQLALWSFVCSNPTRNSRFYLLALSHACDIADYHNITLSDVSPSTKYCSNN